MGRALTVEEHLGVQEAAARLCVSARTLWREIKAGRISPIVKMENKTLVPARAINAWLAARTVVTAPEVRR